jgi:hypothetical protein
LASPLRDDREASPAEKNRLCGGRGEFFIVLAQKETGCKAKVSILAKEAFDFGREERKSADRTGQKPKWQSFTIH